jgi:hypothetical protein
MARRELVRSIAQLYAEQEFVVLLFSDDCLPMLGSPQNKVQFLAATPANKDRLAAWLESVRPGGGTDPRTSLRIALALYPDAIFLLSDGEFRSLNTHRIPIHTIAYQDQRSRHTLETISDDSSGAFRFVR